MGTGTQLGRVRGLGTAKSGTDHWWKQRVTAISNLGLVLWFVISLVRLPDLSYPTIIAWLQQPFLNTLCLIFVAIWASVGVASLILSAAVKNVPQEQLEAARLDGAGEWRILFSIIIPSIAPQLLVVATTQVIFALKIFDIIYVMTNGNFKTNTLANRMYYELFAVGDLGHASAIAVILLIVAIPVVVLNLRQFRK